VSISRPLHHHLPSLFAVLNSLDQPAPPPAFFRAYWLACGWGTAEIVLKSIHLMSQVDLYREVLDDCRPIVGFDAFLPSHEQHPSSPPRPSSPKATPNSEDHTTPDSQQRPDLQASALRLESEPPPPPEALALSPSHRVVVDECEHIPPHIFEDHMRARQRSYMEDSLGVPLYEIPAFVFAVWRVDS
jgi:hypothetical protein